MTYFCHHNFVCLLCAFQKYIDSCGCLYNRVENVSLLLKSFETLEPSGPVTRPSSFPPRCLIISYSTMTLVRFSPSKVFQVLLLEKFTHLI